MNSQSPTVVSDVREIAGLIFSELERTYKPLTKVTEIELKYASRRYPMIAGSFRALFFEERRFVAFVQEAPRINRFVLVPLAPGDVADTLSPKGRFKLLDPVIVVSGGLFIPFPGEMAIDTELASDIRIFSLLQTVSGKDLALEFAAEVLLTVARTVRAAQCESVSISVKDLHDARVIPNVSHSFICIFGTNMLEI